MAIVKGPLMSLSASGQFGKAMVFSNWKGIDICKVYSVPTPTNTAAQQVIRGYFTTAVDAWHAEASSVRTTWTNFAKTNSLAESGFNLYVGKYIEFMMNSSGTPPTVTNTPDTMT